MPRITVNLSTDTVLDEAKVAAVLARKPLANWAGELIETHLAKHRAKAKSGKLLPKI